MVALLASCGGSSQKAVTLSWARVTAQALGAGDGSQPFVDAVEAADDGQPWLLGGAVNPGPSQQVAVWASTSPHGPWTRAQLNAIAGRDGPYETMLYFARETTATVAFGSRSAPREGYPRPSAWVATGHTALSWNETLEPREIFGGPNIVGFGGMAAGAHGFTVAGTWTAPVGGAILAVWTSPDGVVWTRNDSAPAFKGLPGEILFGEGIADSPRGLLLVATAEAPTAGAPLQRHGAILFSAAGLGWTRLLASQIARVAPDSTFDAVSTGGSGWVISGTDSTKGQTWPAVWYVTADHQLGGPIRLGRPFSSVGSHTTALAVDGRHLLVADTNSDRAALWTASIGDNGLGRFAAVTAPHAAVSGLDHVAISASDQGTILALAGTSSSQVWVAPAP